MKLKSILLISVVSVLSTVFVWGTPLQQKTKEHKVEKGETLYSISRKYDVSVDELKKANGGSSAVNVGQTILIPIKGSETPKSTQSKSSSHVVKTGETLYSISRDHEVAVADIKKWNHLTSNELNVGQELIFSEGKTGETTSKTTSNAKSHVVKAGETLYSISRDVNVEVSDLKKWNNLTSNELNVGQELSLIPTTNNNAKEEVKEVKPKENPKPEVVKETTVKTVNKPTQTAYAISSGLKKYDKITDAGKAKVVSSSILDSKFSYCMHPTAPIGTVIKIMNAGNGNYLYARVMGNDSQSGFLIIVNKTVKERLQNSESEFAVKISFVK